MKKRSITKKLILKYQNELLWREHSAATISKYGRDLRFFASWLAREYAGTISKEVIIAYKAALTQQYAASSVNSMLATVNGYLSYMGWHECRVKPLKIQKSSYLAKERELSRGKYRRLLLLS